MAAGFGTTWWGKAWVEALEQSAGLDPARLARGRAFAREKRVNRLEVEPGRITALVRGDKAALPYKVAIDVPTLDDAQWARATAAIAAKAGHAAALLDGELLPSVLSDVRDAGVDLLPGPGELKPRCSCPDWVDPCKHASAVCYDVAVALDADPFVLFALRGRTRDALLAEVRRRRQHVGADPQGGGTEPASGSTDGAADGEGTGPPAPGSGPGGEGRMVAEAFGGGAVVDPGMIAREAWSRVATPTPDRRDLPSTPGLPSAWPADPPRDAPFTAEGLTELAADAARRAWRQLAEGAPSQLDLDVETDLARRAADHLDRPRDMAELARRLAVPQATLTQQAVAWRHAGPEGLHAIDEALWRPPSSVVQAGIRAFEEAGEDVEDIQIRSNRLTCGDVQLRVTSDGRWWRYEKRGRAWDLVEPPADTPEELVSD